MRPSPQPRSQSTSDDLSRAAFSSGAIRAEAQGTKGERDAGPADDQGSSAWFWRRWARRLSQKRSRRPDCSALCSSMIEMDLLFLALLRRERGDELCAQRRVTLLQSVSKLIMRCTQFEFQFVFFGFFLISIRRWHLKADFVIESAPPTLCGLAWALCAAAASTARAEAAAERCGRHC